MSGLTLKGLKLVRYGIYLFVLAAALLSPSRPAAGRLAVLTALLATLVGAAYLLMHRPRLSARGRGGLIAFEIVLTFAIGIMLRGEGSFWLLYFIIVVDAFLGYDAKQAAAISTLTYLVLGINLALLEPPLTRGYVLDMISLLLGFLFTAGAVRLAVEQGEARTRTETLLRELEQAHARLQAYALEVETLSVARERQRLAQEVHDSVAHVLTTLLVQLQAVRRILRRGPEDAAQRLAALEQVARRGLDEVRRAVRAMRPETLQSVGGVDAMRRLCDEFSERTGVRAHFLTEGSLALSPGDEVLLYRALQECLTNAARHGRASTIWARLRGTEEGVELNVRDDGVGAGEIRPGMGLGGMRERAEAAGGRLTFRTNPGAGFEATLELPRQAVVRTA